MVLENTISVMVIYMKASGERIRDMAKESTTIRMGKSTEACIASAKEKAMVLLTTKMVIAMRESGRMGT